MTELKYKLGDWVITKGYTDSYDGKPLLIHSSFKACDETFYNFSTTQYYDITGHHITYDMIERHATVDEILSTIKFSVSDVISFVNQLGDDRSLDDSDVDNIGWVNIFKNDKGRDFKTTQELLKEWVVLNKYDLNKFANKE